MKMNINTKLARRLQHISCSRWWNTIYLIFLITVLSFQDLLSWSYRICLAETAVEVQYWQNMQNVGKFPVAFTDFTTRDLGCIRQWFPATKEISLDMGIPRSP